MIGSTQKVIKVGDSLAVSLPDAEVSRYGIKEGDDVITSIKNRAKKIPILTIRLIDRHIEALKNLG
jgi:antitoxin component of MazEF toxin-antitoxin module